MDSKKIFENVKVENITTDSIELVSNDKVFSEAYLTIVLIVCVLRKYELSNNINGFILDMKESDVSCETLCCLYDMVENLNYDIEISFNPGVYSEYKPKTVVLKKSYKDFLEKAIAEY